MNSPVGTVPPPNEEQPMDRHCIDTSTPPQYPSLSHELEKTRLLRTMEEPAQQNAMEDDDAEKESGSGQQTPSQDSIPDAAGQKDQLREGAGSQPPSPAAAEENDEEAITNSGAEEEEDLEFATLAPSDTRAAPKRSGNTKRSRNIDEEEADGESKSDFDADEEDDGETKSNFDAEEGEDIGSVAPKRAGNAKRTRVAANIDDDDDGNSDENEEECIRKAERLMHAIRKIKEIMLRYGKHDGSDKIGRIALFSSGNMLRKQLQMLSHQKPDNCGIAIVSGGDAKDGISKVIFNVDCHTYQTVAEVAADVAGDLPVGNVDTVGRWNVGCDHPPSMMTIDISSLNFMLLSLKSMSASDYCFMAQMHRSKHPENTSQLHMYTVSADGKSISHQALGLLDDTGYQESRLCEEIIPKQAVLINSKIPPVVHAYKNAKTDHALRIVRNGNSLDFEVCGIDVGTTMASIECTPVYVRTEDPCANVKIDCYVSLASLVKIWGEDVKILLAPAKDGLFIVARTNVDGTKHYSALLYREFDSTI